MATSDEFFASFFSQHPATPTAAEALQRELRFEHGGQAYAADVRALHGHDGRPWTIVRIPVAGATAFHEEGWSAATATATILERLPRLRRALVAQGFVRAAAEVDARARSLEVRAYSGPEQGPAVAIRFVPGGTPVRPEADVQDL